MTIGVASEDITPGALVHTHNTTFQEKDRSYKHATEFRPVEKLPMEERASFQGIVREDGRVGTRNYIKCCANVYWEHICNRYEVERWLRAALHAEEI